MALELTTFADNLVQGAVDARLKGKAYLFNELVHLLPTAKRHSYDAKVDDTIQKIGAVPVEEFYGQLDKVVLPFQVLWLERKFSPLENAQSNGKARPEIGYLIVADENTGNFSFQTFQSLRFSQDASPGGMNVVQARKMFKHGANASAPWAHALAGNRLIYQETNTWIRVDSEGVHFEDDKLLAQIEHTAKFPSYHKSPENVINALCREAEFLAKFFTMFSSPFSGHPNQLKKSAEDYEIEETNRKRIKNGRAPILPLTPIKSDLSKRAQSALEKQDIKEIRILLGWTSVRAASFDNSHGTKVKRKAHSRRIPADVDRREAPREITVSKNNLRLVLENGRIVRKIDNEPKA